MLIRALTYSALCSTARTRHVAIHVLDACGLGYLPMEAGCVHCRDVGNVDDEVPYLAVEVGLIVKASLASLRNAQGQSLGWSMVLNVDLQFRGTISARLRHRCRRPTR